MVGSLVGMNVAPWFSNLPAVAEHPAIFKKQGRDAIFARHLAGGTLVRERARSMGLRLFADPAFASNTVTAIEVPEGVDGKALTKAMREHEGVVIAGGQEHLEGRIMRIGHLGYFSEADLTACMDALERQLIALGHRVPTGAAGA